MSVRTEPIYNRLSQVPEFYPSSTTTFLDGSVEAGDVITVVNDGEEFTTPVYNMTLEWAGNQSVTIDNSGNETIPIQEKSVREKYASSYEAGKTKGGLGGLSQKTDGRFSTFCNLEDLDRYGNGVIKESQFTIDEDGMHLSASKVNIDGRDGEARTSLDSYFEVTSEGMFLSSKKVTADGQTLYSTLKNTAEVLESHKVGIDGVQSWITQTGNTVAFEVNDPNGKVARMGVTIDSQGRSIASIEADLTEITGALNVGGVITANKRIVAKSGMQTDWLWVGNNSLVVQNEDFVTSWNSGSVSYKTLVMPQLAKKSGTNDWFIYDTYDQTVVTSVTLPTLGTTPKNVWLAGAVSG